MDKVYSESDAGQADVVSSTSAAASVQLELPEVQGESSATSTVEEAENLAGTFTVYQEDTGEAVFGGVIGANGNSVPGSSNSGSENGVTTAAVSSEADGIDHGHELNVTVPLEADTQDPEAEKVSTSPQSSTNHNLEIHTDHPTPSEAVQASGKMKTSSEEEVADSSSECKPSAVCSPSADSTTETESTAAISSTAERCHVGDCGATSMMTDTNTEEERTEQPSSSGATATEGLIESDANEAMPQLAAAGLAEVSSPSAQPEQERSLVDQRQPADMQLADAKEEGENELPSSSSSPAKKMKPAAGSSFTQPTTQQVMSTPESEQVTEEPSGSDRTDLGESKPNLEEEPSSSSSDIKGADIAVPMETEDKPEPDQSGDSRAQEQLSEPDQSHSDNNENKGSEPSPCIAEGDSAEVDNAEIDSGEVDSAEVKAVSTGVMPSASEVDVVQCPSSPKNGEIGQIPESNMPQPSTLEVDVEQSLPTVIVPNVDTENIPKPSTSEVELEQCPSSPKIGEPGQVAESQTPKPSTSEVDMEVCSSSVKNEGSEQLPESHSTNAADMPTKTGFPETVKLPESEADTQVQQPMRGPSSPLKRSSPFKAMKAPGAKKFRLESIIQNMGGSRASSSGSAGPAPSGFGGILGLSAASSSCEDPSSEVRDEISGSDHSRNISGMAKDNQEFLTPKPYPSEGASEKTSFSDILTPDSTSIAEKEVISGDDFSLSVVTRRQDNPDEVTATASTCLEPLTETCEDAVMLLEDESLRDVPPTDNVDQSQQVHILVEIYA